MRPDLERRASLAVVTLAVVGLVAWGPVERHARAARVLTRFGADEVVSVPTRELDIARLRARAYGAGDPILLVHGVHPDGMDEPRLRRFAAILAAEGFEVVTPQLDALATFRLDPRTSDRIAAAARALAARADRRAVGVVGISVGGGLALQAAVDEPRIGAVFAIGAHHDARRLARWWTGDAIEGPGGEPVDRAPEVYGMQVLAHGWAEDAFGDEAPAARAALERMFRGQRPDAGALSTEAQGRLEALRRPPAPDWLRALVETRGDELGAASPAGVLDRVRADVFLLHGEDDPVVASTESLWIARELRDDHLGGVVRTPLLGHADQREVGLAEQLRVVHLAADALGALRGP